MNLIPVQSFHSEIFTEIIEMPSGRKIQELVWRYKFEAKR